MKNIEMVDKDNETIILVDGKKEGVINRIGDNDYAWQSVYAIPPYKVGRAKSECEALAHIGFKFI